MEWFSLPFWLQLVKLMMLYTGTTEHGEIFAWGLNQHGQCGIRPLMTSTYIDESFKISPSDDWILNVYLPLKVEGLPAVAEVHCGWSHTLAITAGKLLSRSQA